MNNKVKPLYSTENKFHERTMSDEERLAELRHLILGDMEPDVAEIKQRLDDGHIRAGEISQVLPEAIIIGSSRDDNLATAITPAVDKAIRASIKGNLKTFADALFPVMGPAIRKAIAEALRGMLQSLNEVMDKSFSWQGVKWRLESLKTRKPFSEIVMLHSLVYRVEQVFLIHKNTGLMLAHVVREETDVQDADMVSSMLTAIRDFVADSFKVQESDGLEAIRVGELSVWIEQGPKAVLAVVIRGNAPQNLGNVLKETLENIHLHYGSLLESFEGETAPFESLRPNLDACLVSQYQPTKKKTSPLLVGALALVLGAAFFLIGLAFNNHLKWKHLKDDLGRQEGILVTATETDDGKYVVRGLKDEFAIDPEALVKQAGIDPEDVIFQWTPYQALSEGIVLERAKKVLNPPDTVSLSLKKGVLSAEGTALRDWEFEAKRIAKSLQGIATFETDKLIDPDSKKRQVFNEFAQALKNERGVVITSADDSHGQYKISGFLDPLARNPLDLLKSMDSDELNIVFHWEPYQSMDPYLTLERMKKALKPENTILMRVEDGCIVVSGAATHRWIGEFRQWSRLASGFPCWKENNLVDLDVVKLDNLKSKIESQKIFFRDNVYNPSKEQLESVDQVADNIKEAVRVAKTSGIPLHIIVSGHADQAGSEETNLRISRSRADTLVDLLKAKGIPSTQLSLEAEGSAQRISSADTEQGRALNRRVSFQVLINDDVKHD
jgi:outer membrane protein OmpA-like peptidoglycan-associated protein